MTEIQYHRKKNQICNSQKLTEQQKKTKMFNLWIDLIFNSVKTAKSN